MTRILAYLREAFEAIWRNRARSLLTMLGMIIGTSSIIAILGVSRAAAGGITGTLASFGDPGIIVSVDPNQDDPASAQIQFRDIAPVEAATERVVDRVVPQFNGTYKLRSNGIAYDTTVTSNEAVHDDTLTLHEGRRLNAGDIETAARVALLSQPLARRFYGDASALGATMRIGGSRFRIIGVYDEFKASLLSTVAGQDYIEIPYSTFHQLKPGPADFIQVYPKPSSSVAAAGDAVIAALRRIHGSRVSYLAQDATAQLAGFNKSLGVIALGLTAIGGVALVVAGIGIMNIMLVSVTERTREIGIRKAIGASRGDITLQFLLEAIALSALGGGIGTVLGFLATLAGYSVVQRFVGPAPIPYLLIISVAVGFSTLVGTVFGTYPALRAGRMDPIEALRA